MGLGRTEKDDTFQSFLARKIPAALNSGATLSSPGDQVRGIIQPLGKRKGLQITGFKSNLG